MLRPTNFMPFDNYQDNLLKPKVRKRGLSSESFPIRNQLQESSHRNKSAE